MGSSMIFDSEKRNYHLAKWNVLFDKNVSHWCSFKPKNGARVYPCYACRDMFGSKNSFLDHVNRRGLLINYTCKECLENSNLTFYNPCSFLLHTRSHFKNMYGQIDLDDVNISTLPFGLAGLPPHPEIPMLYDVEEDSVGDTVELNTRFYSATSETVGQRIVILTPLILIFDDTTSSEDNITGRLVLKQLSSNIPYCKFLPVTVHNRPAHLVTASPDCINLTDNQDVNVKTEPPEFNEIHTEVDLPISKVEAEYGKQNEPDKPLTLQNTWTPPHQLVTKHIPMKSSAKIMVPKCPECNVVQKTSMTEHFLGQNRPFNASLKCVCKFIAPTLCSLRAHTRLHEGIEPFICPECGRDFESIAALSEHLDEVCFHLAKQVRFRCPAKNCGKIFAQTQTYSAHFLLHMLCISRCTTCDMNFLNNEQFFEHMKIHDTQENSQKLFKCTVCKEQDETFVEANYKEHVHQHCTDRSQCVYVYLCKFCRSYFRSTLTYATHLLRCSKKEWAEDKGQQRKIIVTICLKCNYRIKLTTNMTVTVCPRCGAAFSTSYQLNNAPTVTDEYDLTADSDIEQISCKLCDSYEHETFSISCKYATPKVVVSKLSEEELDKPHLEDPLLEIKEERVECLSPKSDDSLKRGQSSDDGLKRKKKRVNGTPKNKKQSPTFQEKQEEVPADEPTPFDGLYRCRLCDFNNEHRNEFHEHIITHRDVSTTYQCMECGECFVVKPSLLKHLLFYHQIHDVERYLEENNCYDRNAVKELEQMTKFPQLVPKEAVAENQCRVCRQQFPDSLELNKHFRIHGMAFLMQNYK